MLSRFITAAAAALLAVSCSTPNGHVVVSVADQRMAVIREHQVVRTFPVSTSKFGLGDRPGTNSTPLGHLEVAKKIGGGQPSGMKFKSRRPTGEIVRPNTPGRDPIVTRILWLRGLESQNANAYRRFIYIHGTPEERKLGAPASFGCVRMASRDVIWLYNNVSQGAKVDITTQPLRSAIPGAGNGG